MLPQVDTHVLAANPQFARLCHDLYAAKLNADGATRTTDSRKLKQQEAVSTVRASVRVDIDGR